MEDHETALRKKAEDILGKAPEAIKEVPPEAIKNLIHELQVHQIELEMQNEELRRTQLKLETSRDKYSDLYDFAPTGYFTLSDKGMILDANLTGAAMLGVERGALIDSRFSGFITSDTADSFYFHRRQVCETNRPQTFELELKKKDGSQFWAQLGSVPVLSDEGNCVGIRMAVTNITPRKIAEERARKSTQLDELLIDSLPHPAMLISKDRKIMVANRVAREVGCKVGEYCWGSFGQSEYIPDHDKRYMHEHKGQIPQGGTQCTFCLADEMFEANKPTNDPEVSAFGQLWDTWWVPVSDDLYLHYAINITERKQFEDSIRASAEIVKAIPSGLFIYQFEPPDRLILVDGNPASETLTGIKVNEWCGKEFNDIWPGGRESGITGALLDVMKSGKRYEDEDYSYKDDRFEGFFRLVAFPIPENRLAVAIEDVTERKGAEKALRDSERRFQALTSLAPVGIYLTDKNGNYLYVNERWCEMTGMSNQETWGDGWIKGVHPDDRDLVSKAWKKMAESESKWGVEYRFQTPQGEITFVLSLASPMRDPGGQVTGYIGANLDITHLKRTEELLRVSLDEKDVLLKEIHHRVKNNLQIIAGLLNMSSMEAVNKEAKDILQDARGKVYAMALIHSQLYQNDRFDAINIANHINRLAVQLSHAYRDNAGSVHTVVEPAEVYVTLNQGIPCGLVANELITNSLKHAFEGRKQGTIKVYVFKNEDDMITIKVKDDGIGIPETVEIEKPKTLGITLLKALVRQLKGTLQLKRDKGTEAIVQFKAVPEEEQHDEDSDRRR